MSLIGYFAQHNKNMQQINVLVFQYSFCCSSLPSVRLVLTETGVVDAFLLRNNKRINTNQSDKKTKKQ